MNLSLFDDRSRNDLLERYRKALAAMYAAYRAAESASKEQAERHQAEGDRQRAIVSDLWDEYVARTPKVPLSRCPLTGEIFRHSIDPFGLDGMWWDCEHTARPDEELPKTAFALTGAVKLTDPVEQTDFLVKPGPEVPYVLPRILKRPEIVAVVSQLTIGKHTAYPIVYFADPIPYDHPRANTWGRKLFEFLDPEGNPRWGEYFDAYEDYDFDLAEWVRDGRLLWIAPGDLAMLVRSGVDGCPYLDLPGRRYPLNLQNGEAWPAVVLPDGLEEKKAGPDQAPPPVARFCRNCGTALNPGAKFCRSCGTPVRD